MGGGEGGGDEPLVPQGGNRRSMLQTHGRQASTIFSILASSKPDHGSIGDSDNLGHEQDIQRESAQEPETVTLGLPPPAGARSLRRQTTDQLNRAAAGATLVRKNTLLSVEAQKELEASNPEALSYMQSAAGMGLQIVMLALYVLLDTSKGLVTKWAVQGGKVQVSSLIIMNSFISIIIGFLFAVKFDGMEKATAAIKDFKSILQFSMVAALFSISNIFNILAYTTELNPGTIKILGQMRLPLAALMSRIFLGKKYNLNQWLLLGVLTLTVLVFYEGTQDRDEITDAHEKARIPAECFASDGGSKSSSPKCSIVGLGPSVKASDTVGLMYIAVWIVIVVSASLVTERFMKSGPKTPYYIQKMWMEITGVLVAIACAFLFPLFVQGAAWDQREAKRMWWTETTLHCTAKNMTLIVTGYGAPSAENICEYADKHHATQPNSEGKCPIYGQADDSFWDMAVGGKGLFESWQMATLVQLTVAIAQGWGSGIIVKQFSTVVKNIAKSISLILTVFANEIFFHICWAPPLEMSMYALSVSVFFITMLFSQLPDEKLPPPPAPPAPPPKPPAAAGLDALAESDEDADAGSNRSWAAETDRRTSRWQRSKSHGDQVVSDRCSSQACDSSHPRGARIIRIMS